MLVPSGGAGGDPILPHRLTDQREEDQYPGPGGSVHPGGLAAALVHIPGEIMWGCGLLLCVALPQLRSTLLVGPSRYVAMAGTIPWDEALTARADMV